MKIPAARPAKESAAAATTNAHAFATLGPIARSSVVDTVADRLRREILSGRLEKGARLPSERELALSLGVNRLTLRASLAQLEAMGLIAVRHGAGTVVADWRERAGLDALSWLAGVIDPSEPMWLEMMLSVLEVRRILASEAAALASERHAPEDLDALRAIAAEQAGRVGDPVAFARGEVAFTRAVVRAAKNVGLELVLNTFARFPDEHPTLVTMLYDQTEMSLGFYDVMIRLIAAKNASFTRETIRKVLEGVDHAWVERHFAGPRASATARPNKDEARAPKAASKREGGRDTRAERAEKAHGGVRESGARTTAREDVR
jgi:GntR family transcriptional repressor for pyruvate dehydrogenase complex